MQNNPEKKPGAFKTFLKEKGYYIVLGLCVVAVGVSGFLFVKTAADRNQPAPAQSPTLSVPLTPSGGGGSGGKTTGGSKPASAAKPTIPSAAEDAAETVAPDVTAPEPAVTVIQTVRPLSGDTVGDYSMDALAYNETTQDWRTHDGIDIAAAVGDPVSAARDGTVSAVYDDNALGRTVVVNHENGCSTRYSNLAEETAVTVGQQVKAGDLLGTVGDTATVELAQAGHLHFAVYRGQEPMNPEAFLSD